MRLADSFERNGVDDCACLRVDLFDGVELARERPQRAFAIRDHPHGTWVYRLHGHAGSVDADDGPRGASAGANKDGIRADLHMRPALLAAASGEGDRVDHVIDGRVDSQERPVAEDPDASRTHLDVGGRHAESDRAHDV
jgi:hypothetical protein